MKKTISTLSFILLLSTSAFQANAQEDISNIFKAGVVDLNKVANGYLTPAGNSFAAGLGTNWYNTAAVHKVGGFDLTIGAGAVIVPEEDQTFSLLGLTNLKSTTGATQAPTFAGKGDGVQLDLMQPQTLANGNPNPLYPGKITSFTTPQGISKYIPTASLQFTIGLPLINDVSVRYVPKVSVQGFETSLWGIGIKHNFKRWIPVVKLLPFDASVMASYTKFDMKYALPTSAQVTPDKLVGTGVQYIPDANSSDYTTQAMNMSASAMNASLIVSKKLLFITPYAGVGITKTHFNVTMAGNYPTLGDPTYSGGAYKMQIKNVTDPIDIKGDQVMTNATVGLRMKLLFIFAFHAQYTFQKYPTASVGLGINIR